VASLTEKYTLEVDGRVLSLTNRQKVLWPADGITKGDLVDYYRRIAPYVLHHIAGRPLTVERYPNGIDGPSFFEKNISKGAPSWVETVPVPSDSGKRDVIRFMLCNDEATLLYVANLAAIVLHVWTSQAGSLDVPDFVFFDLDPFDGCTLATLAKTALALRELLDSVGLETLVKTSGGSGLHVVVPLEPVYGYDICRGSPRSSRGRSTPGSPRRRPSSGCKRSGRRARFTWITSKWVRGKLSSRPTAPGLGRWRPSPCPSRGARWKRWRGSERRKPSQSSLASR
jgi:bifunctional non-homologous end joining protein LigD